ncbi:hypothetical protein EJ110_NYTH21441 [Nymphaea thermarum]|nr:hypothetical protein EJ110_NYTH21441 [Nymphaea thermarum]
MDQPNSSILSSSFLSQLISQKLNHSNYLTWKRQIVSFIKSHRLYGHIDGTTPAPPQYIDREVKRTVVADQGGGASTGSEIRFEYETVTENNHAYEVWLAHNQSLVAYITSTLSEEVLGGVDDDLTALELWSTLATTYSQVSEARFLQLRRQFQDIKRGTRTVLEQGAEMLPKQKEQATNEPETIIDTSLDSTASLKNMSSSPQQDDDPPRDNRFSGLVYSRRTVPTIAPRQSQRVRHPIDRWVTLIS